MRNDECYKIQTNKNRGWKPRNNLQREASGWGSFAARLSAFNQRRNPLQFKR